MERAAVLIIFGLAQPVSLRFRACLTVCGLRSRDFTKIVEIRIFSLVHFQQPVEPSTGGREILIKATYSRQSGGEFQTNNKWFQEERLHETSA